MLGQSKGADMRAVAFLSVLFLAATTANAAKWTTEGSVMWGACARGVQPHATTVDGYNAGMCIGTINTVVFLKDDVCVPDGVSRGQAERVVIRFFETHPELLHLDGVTLVHSALREAWPCR